MKHKAIQRSNLTRDARGIGVTGAAVAPAGATNAIKGVASGALSRAAVVVPGTRRPCALIVDDDPAIRRALQRALGPELEVHVAGTVAEGASLMNELDRVDLALVDLELPDESGERILERLTRWPDAIRVLISGRVLSNENPLANRSLANLVLPKPLPARAILALKRAALGLPRD
jgi:CheY-like chemotaxis protein